MTDTSKEAFKYQCECNLAYVSNTDKVSVRKAPDTTYLTVIARYIFQMRIKMCIKMCIKKRTSEARQFSNRVLK